MQVKDMCSAVLALVHAVFGIGVDADVEAKLARLQAAVSLPSTEVMALVSTHDVLEEAVMTAAFFVEEYGRTDDSEASVNVRVNAVCEIVVPGWLRFRDAHVHFFTSCVCFAVVRPEQVAKYVGFLSHHRRCSAASVTPCRRTPLWWRGSAKTARSCPHCWHQWTLDLLMRTVGEGKLV